VSAAEDEGESTILGGEGNGPWAVFGRGLDSVPEAFLFFFLFLSLFFSVFFCENFKKHQNNSKKFEF
jgi:hypothetical protein